MEEIISLLKDNLLEKLCQISVLMANPEIKEAISFLQSDSSLKLNDKTIISKIKEYKENAEKEAKSIAEELKEKKSKKKKIKIYLDGVFDIIHSGHFNAIRQASKLGDILLCGVNSDEDVLKNKGPTLLNVNERAMLVKACKWCDEAALSTPFSPTCETLDQYNCDYCSHGDDITFNAQGVSCLDDIIKKNRLKVFKRTEGVSTTEIIGRLIMAFEDKIKELDKNDIKNKEIIQNFEELTKFKSTQRPILSSFLATSWRICEFSSKKVPKPNDKIVYFAGDFDILHIGHIAALEKAREFGDFVYAGVYDDELAHKIHGKNFPVLNMNERIFNLLAMRNVDEVVMGAPYMISEDMIKHLNINVVLIFTTKGNKSKEENDLVYAVPKKMGILKVVEIEYELSNQILIDRLWENKENYIKKYLNKAKKEIEIYKPNNKNVTEI